MAVLDLIGVPFPKDHPEFKDDAKLQKLIFQIESLIEIGHDLDDVVHLVGAQQKLEEDVELSLHISSGLLGLLPSELGKSAVLMFTRCFNSAQNRSQLSPKVVFSSPETFQAYKKIHAARDDFVAHQQANANKHYLFALPSQHNGKPTVNFDGQTSRLLFHTTIDWREFLELVNLTKLHIRKRITGLCGVLSERLTRAQSDVINSLDVALSRNEHWERTRDAALNPLKKRPNGH